MKYLVGTMCGGLMEDPTPRFDGPYLIVEAPDEKTARELYNKATKASYFYGDVLGNEDGNTWHLTSPYVSHYVFNSVLDEAKPLNLTNVQEKKV